MLGLNYVSEIKRKLHHFTWRENEKHCEILAGIKNCRKKHFNKLTTAYEQALRHSSIFWLRSLADIKNKSRICDARIESILLDVNNKEGTESLWWWSPVKDQELKWWTPVKRQDGICGSRLPLAGNIILRGAFLCVRIIIWHQDLITIPPIFTFLSIVWTFHWKKSKKKCRWPIMTKEELRIFRNIICVLQ